METPMGPLDLAHPQTPRHGPSWLLCIGWLLQEPVDQSSLCAMENGLLWKITIFSRLIICKWAISIHFQADYD